ncbi:hypothetical protein MNBD_GAMMA01-365 [hydrothermal vent metagenome]|uniref:Uncharacterized protein n=1 Tax=hydrothermal vent metagenome TaxID=652676 RepID=A0A3B0VCV8_9ZZZZ
MLHRILIIFGTALCLNAVAVTYTKDQINHIIHNDRVETASKTFVRGFFIAKNPKEYIDDFILNKKSTLEPLVIEYQLYQLLSEVAYQPKQQFLQDFVNAMQQYKHQAFRTHDEGSMLVAVYNLQAKAKGVVNIWLVAESLNYYTNWFNNNPIATVSRLKSTSNTLSTPQWLGLKSSISNISPDDHIKLVDYLLDTNNISGLDKFISHYSLLTANKDLVQMAILHLDKSNSEYILRHLSNYFATDFVVAQLLYSVENGKNQAFALSLMSPYVDSYNSVNKLLFQYLSHDKFATSAAFALANTRDTKILHQLASAYVNSQSDIEKQQIIFTLKLNKLPESEVILTDIIQHGTTNIWLNSFKGVVQ